MYIILYKKSVLVTTLLILVLMSSSFIHLLINEFPSPF